MPLSTSQHQQSVAGKIFPAAAKNDCINACKGLRTDTASDPEKKISNRKKAGARNRIASYPTQNLFTLIHSTITQSSPSAPTSAKPLSQSPAVRQTPDSFAARSAAAGGSVLRAKRHLARR